MKLTTKLYFQKTGILLAVYLVLRFLLPLILPFFLAWITVGALRFFQKKIHIRLTALSIGYILFFLLLFGVSIFCGCLLLYEPCCRLMPSCQEYWAQFSAYLTWLPESLSGYLADAMPTALSCLFGLFLYLISVFLFARDWEHFHRMLCRLPFALPVYNAGQRIIVCVKGWIRAQCRIMIIVSLECAAGYFLLNVPGFLFWALLTGMIDALPVFGTGTVFFPWAAAAALQGDYTFALWLGLLYLITWLTRELLEPRLLGDGLGLLPICFLMSVIAGLKLFGALGLFTGPFGVLLIRELWHELENVSS
ncbi:MAG: AI-2E family transporter [Lachnospiraceae bacterium]|nr:AI-2E family transporter [Lachnospiraceae bacterium]